MDELEKLHKVLVREGLYTKSLDEFKQRWSDESYRDKVYKVTKRDGLYSKDQASYNQK